MKSNKKRNLLIAITVIILFLVGLAIMSLGNARKSARRVQCLSTLRSMSLSFRMYCDDNKGNLPTDISLLGKGGYLDNKKFFICPWDGKIPGDWNNIKDWTDYIYIPWQSTTGVYEKYPLMYDRRLSNHGNKGINVLLVEQIIHPAFPTSRESFHGQFFWDEGATWLQKFAKEHPDLNIPLPEGLHKK